MLAKSVLMRVLACQPRDQLLRHVSGGRLEAGHRRLRRARTFPAERNAGAGEHVLRRLYRRKRKRLRVRCTTIALKLSRPGLGPPLKRLGRTVPSRRHAGRKSLSRTELVA